MKKILLLALLVIFMAGGQAMASKPIQLSLTPNFAIYSRTTQIEGLSLSIWGENPQTSLALGFFNGFTGSSKGFALGIFLNYSDSYKGVQWGGVNYTKGSMLGWQAGIVDYVDGSMKGLQTGLVNYAGHLKGVQFGSSIMPSRRQQAFKLVFSTLCPKIDGLQISRMRLRPE